MRIAISAHRRLPAAAQHLIDRVIRKQLAAYDSADLIGVSCLSRTERTSSSPKAMLDADGQLISSARRSAEIAGCHSWLGLAEPHEPGVRRRRHDGRAAMAEDWNSKIVAEFRAKGGKVGGPFEGAPLLLLHTRGARTGEERVNPVMYRTDDGRLVVFASKAGADTNPDWFHNLRAHPHATVEVGTETRDVVARVAEGAERHRLWEAQKQEWPGFAGYERRTERQIPVIILEPVC
jgi:deazaflavin-dependent oxidoreductase (nitroreductase family)